MINVKNKRCISEGCGSLNPAFDVVGGKGRFCAKHKTAGMVDVKSKQCEYSDCTTKPVFGNIGGKVQFCVNHKTADMVDLRNKQCAYTDCTTRPQFGIKGGKATFCVSHKMADMVDVLRKSCSHPGCTLGPAFGTVGGKPLFCVSHKAAGMVDVKSKRCLQEGCDSRPSFDVKGGSGRFCVLHKEDGMVDVHSKQCEHTDCTLQPSFDIKDGKGRFCLLHKTISMVDVKHSVCDHEGCESRTSYGKPGYSPNRCAKHREVGMIRKSNAKCVSCKELAIWGVNWIPRHCEAHKTEEDENLVERPCSSCSLLYVLDKTTRCENCNPESWGVARLVKQNALMDYLENRGLSGSSTDKPLEDSLCGKERPDRVYDLGDKIVILECDEYQHRERACLCEQTRMVNIGQSFGGIPVYFLRWNPDEYRSEKGMERLSNRHKLCGDLIADIQAGRTRLPVALVAALYLYYDGWSTLAEESWKVLTPILSVEHSSQQFTSLK
jgi:putative hemolysin